MRSVKRVLSFAFALMMVLAVLPMSGKASGGADLYVIVAEGGTITAQGAGSFESGQASEGTVLSISLDPAAFPEYTFDHWESVYGDRIPQESFRLLVDQDAYFFPVFSDVVAHFGEWELVRHGETCEDGDIYKRTDPETGLVEYGFMMRNYGSHDFGDYEYLDEDHCAAVCRYCGYVDVQEHSWSSGEVIREATHTTPGIVRRTCYRCGATVDTDIGTTEEHSWGPWEIVTPSVNGQPGIRRRTCVSGDASEEYWYIDADWESYYTDERITFTASYQSQYGNKKEGHYSFINNDGKRAWVYGASWADKNNERVVAFMWIDDPDELGRRAIYHAKKMTNGWGYGWALIGYADTFDDYIEYIDRLWNDQSGAPHSSSLFDMFRMYESYYNDALLPASGSSDFFEGRTFWHYQGDTVIRRGRTNNEALQIPVKIYSTDNGEAMYIDPETNTCLYYTKDRMSYYINSMTQLVSDEVYAGLSAQEQAEVYPYSELTKRVSYDTANNTQSLWLEYLEKPTPRYFRVIIDGSNSEQYADDPNYDSPYSFSSNYPVPYIEEYHLTSDLAGGGYYRHGYHMHDFGIAGTLLEPKYWYSNQNYSITIRHDDPEGWAFDRWEIYNWETGEWDEFTETNSEGEPCLNYTEVNEDKTAFTIDHRLTDIPIVRARFTEVPVETVHIKVTGGYFLRITSGGTYYFDSEGDVPVGSMICPVDEYSQTPAGKQFDHWTMFVGGEETEIEWQNYNYNRCVEVTADTEFRAVYTDASYWLNVYGENGMVYLDGEEFWGGEYFSGTELTLTTEGDEGYPYFYGWYMQGDKEKGMIGAEDKLLGTDTTLHYTTTAAYATIAARWGETETEPVEEIPSHDVTAVNGFICTFESAPGSPLLLSSLRVSDYTDVYVIPDPTCGLDIERFDLTYTLEDLTYTESEDWDEEYGSVSFWIGNSEDYPQELTITGFGTAHTHRLEYIMASEPTCTEEGNIEYWYCTGCGRYFSSEAAADSDEITHESTVIPALGHDWSESWEPFEEGHCHVCTRCGEKTELEPHVFGAWQSSAETPDKEYRSCTLCGYTEQREKTGELRGDMNGDCMITSDDAIYLLRHALSPERYPIDQSGDVNGDGMVTSDDAIYLLRHTLSPERYPLH